MELEVEIKEEPVWLEGPANSPLMSNQQLPTADDMLTNVKIEPQHAFADQTVEETGIYIAKEEYEIKVSNLLCPTGDNELTEVKFESQDVFSNQTVEEDGVSLVKEKYQIKDENKETQDEPCDPLADMEHERLVLVSQWCTGHQHLG